MDQLTPFPDRPSTVRPRTLGVDAALRVGELERATACDALAEHYAAGRLDPAELDDRLARAMAARSQGDLRVLFLDLGPRRTPGTALTPDVAPAPPARDGTVSVLASLMVICLLVAGGMLAVLGTYDFALFVAALLGGTATAVAGACATAIAQVSLRRP